MRGLSMDEKLFIAVCNKLGLLDDDKSQVEATWNAEARHQNFSERVTLICNCIAAAIYETPDWDQFIPASEYRDLLEREATSKTPKVKVLSKLMEVKLLPMSIRNSDASDHRMSTVMAATIVDHLRKFAALRRKLVDDAIRAACGEVRRRFDTYRHLPPVAPVTPSPKTSPLGTGNPHLNQIPRTTPEMPSAYPVQTSSIEAAANAIRAEPSNRVISLPPSTTSTAPAERSASHWKDLPLPVDEPDLHTAWDKRSAAVTNNMQIVGARVRGKKHKHEGTNCDDWFDFDTSGQWTIMAVSDGAGSKKFSRVGAKAACNAAVRSLKAKLRNHIVESRTSWTAEAFQQDDLLQVKHCLVTAMQDAWNAVVQAAADRADSLSHQQVLGRPLLVSDLLATLLVAVHTTVIRDGAEVSLAFGCSVGDGMIAAIGKKGSTHTLMTADSGEHSGETRFLDEREIATEKLEQRIFPFLGSLRALLLMTDGVSDDYFPNETGMSDLYGDLVLNGILPRDATFSAMLPQSTSIAPETFQTLSGRDAPGGWERIVVRSIKSYAMELGKTPLEVWTNPQWLADAIAGEPLCDSIEPDERLRTWLDSYTVRGSFDDRTLVALFH
jgi:serine/threonine protein phosphatase PrpC